VSFSFPLSLYLFLLLSYFSSLHLTVQLWNEKLTTSCLSGNGSKDVAEVLLTLKKKEWADKLDWQVAQ